MAKKVVVLSDISGQEVPDEESVEIRVLELDNLSQPVRLDASTTEADRLRLDNTSLALLELVMPDGTLERVALPADQFKKSIKGDADEVLANAEGLNFTAPEPEQSRRRGRRPRGEGAAQRTERVDYTAEENFGLVHRGKVTEEEAALVRGDMEQANANRARAGQPAIDPNDAKEAKRYGLTTA